MAQQEEKKEISEDVSSLREALVSELKKTTVENLLKELNLTSKVIVLDSKTDPKKAIEILIENKVRAAPVIDTDTNKFIGVLDLRDTVKFALETYKKQSTKLSEIKQKAMEYLTSSPQITTQTLKYLSQMRKFRTVKTDNNLLDVAQILTQGSHIVGVIDKDKNTLCGIITQGQLFKQVAIKWGVGKPKQDAKNDDDNNDNNSCWPKNKYKVELSQLLTLKYITSPVKSIKNTVKAYEAFELMSKLDLSGLAVIDNNDKLIHNTSATDIKLWLIASSTLEDSIEQFLINIRKLSLNDRYPICFCTKDKDLRVAVEKLAVTGYDIYITIYIYLYVECIYK